MSRIEDFDDLDPHEVLRVSPHASHDQIKQAHRRLSRKTHPDIGGNSQAQKRLNWARDALIDPKTRKQYDERRHAPECEEVYDREEEPVFVDPYDDWEPGPGPGTAAQPPSYTYDGRSDYVDPSLNDVYGPPSAHSYRLPPPYQWHPPQQPFPRPHRAAPRRRWNTLSILAVALTFCGPPGLVLGIIALAEIRRTRERGAALAWLAVAVSAVLLLCWMVEVFVVMTNSAHLPVPVVSPHGSRTAR